MTHPVLDIRQVLDYLPHRYPFLLVDRIVEYREEGSLVALKNVTINEPFFQGHFPGNPVMPGVLVLEALAQACAILSFLASKTLPRPDMVYYLAGIDGARFRRPVVPGDQLRLEVTTKRRLRGVWMYETRALVDGEEVAGANMMSAFRAIGGDGA